MQRVPHRSGFSIGVRSHWVDSHSTKARVCCRHALQVIIRAASYLPRVRASNFRRAALARPFRARHFVSALGTGCAELRSFRCDCFRAGEVLFSRGREARRVFDGVCVVLYRLIFGQGEYVAANRSALIILVTSCHRIFLRDVAEYGESGFRGCVEVDGTSRDFMELPGRCE